MIAAKKVIKSDWSRGCLDLRLSWLMMEIPGSTRLKSRGLYYTNVAFPSNMNKSWLYSVTNGTKRQHKYSIRRASMHLCRRYHFLLYNTASKTKKQNIPTYICQHWTLYQLKTNLNQCRDNNSPLQVFYKIETNYLHLGAGKELFVILTSLNSIKLG